VHGLQGHPEKSFTADLDKHITLSSFSFFNALRRDATDKSRSHTEKYSIYWPRDLLPADLPSARIMTFGYDAGVIEKFFGRANQSGVIQHAGNMLVDLLRKRREPSEEVRISRLTYMHHNKSLKMSATSHHLCRPQSGRHYCQRNLASIRDLTSETRLSVNIRVNPGYYLSRVSSPWLGQCQSRLGCGKHVSSRATSTEQVFDQVSRIEERNLGYLRESVLRIHHPHQSLLVF
jgi:hypothetical protein